MGADPFPIHMKARAETGGHGSRLAGVVHVTITSAKPKPHTVQVCPGMPHPSRPHCGGVQERTGSKRPQRMASESGPADIVGMPTGCIPTDAGRMPTEVGRIPTDVG